jgi:hypothetical protein
MRIRGPAAGARHAPTVVLTVVLTVVSTVALAVALSGCGGSSRSPDVPTLGGGPTRSPQAAGATGPARVAALHAAAQCVREHGIPTYQDPVLTADGHVFTDARSLREADGDNRDTPTLNAVRRACGQLMIAAGFQPDDQAPAPPKLVAAGVKAAQCMRSHGLPNYQDPNSATPFTPGHGFGISADQLPAGGKADPVTQQAADACRSLLDEEIRLSTLGSLGNG